MVHSLPLPLEICVDSAEGLAVAESAGADRVELCAALPLGGLTPGPGLIAAARAAQVPCHAMIRPRPGDFLFEDADLRSCLDDIAAIRAAGLAGVVIGAAGPDARLDLRALEAMITAAGPMQVTLHRVFDLTPDPFEALEQAIGLGITRILTSGQAPAAPDGIALLKALAQRADRRIEIMAGGGVMAEAAAALIATGVNALHSSCSTPAPLRQPAERIGIAPSRDTNKNSILALRAAMRTSEEVV
ncbi:copper homeostasis protein CutC [Tropicimonas sp. TH_r6]|uniref:copper homeostasis protein CutC n=1 Tax=Tropicimonas sp. TH_r6 TaxID=3082085 RepID=UPI002953B1AE|nr:copper homeostasis protein CutC [Tropicimonas sp. TH_r6]MDV7141446.1 copper homeostasis protein CutC [Tropicimonas sp. TH_r6]